METLLSFLVLLVTFVIWEQCSVQLRVNWSLLLKKISSLYPAQSPRKLRLFQRVSTCGPLSAVTFRKVISPVLHPHTHVLIGNQLNTQWRILWKSLEFSICVVLFSLIIYPVNSICCGSLDSVPYPQLFASTELNLGSSSLTCSLKTLSRDLYLNCLESSYLKTVATYIFFFLFFFFLGQEDKSNLCHFILTQSWH